MSAQAITTRVQKPMNPSKFPWKYFAHTTLKPYVQAAQLASVIASDGRIIGMETSGHEAQYH